TGEHPRIRNLDDQVQAWREMADLLHKRMGELDGLIERAYQGRNCRMFFDTEYGGFFFKYLRPRDPHSKIDPGIYLFAATLNQEEIDNRSAIHHFNLLSEALEQIDHSIRQG